MDSTIDVTSAGGQGSPDGDVRVSALSTYTYEGSGGIRSSGPLHYTLDTDFIGTISGGPLISGTSVPQMGAYVYVASGGLVISGIIYALDYCYIAIGGITLGGTPSVPGNRYELEGEGTILVEGSPDISIPHRTTSMLGGIDIDLSGSGHADAYHTDQNRRFYYYFSFSTYNLVFTGQAGIVSSAPTTYAVTAAGGVDLGWNAEAYTTGLPGGQFPYVGTGGIELAGRALTSTPDVVPIVSGHGGAEVAGSYESRVVYRYDATGVVFLGGFGSAPATSAILIDQWFNWNVFAEINVDQRFEWGFGESILYWFQVESCCEPTTCDRFIVDDGGQCRKTTMTTTILATNVEDVCRQLTDRSLDTKICSIKQFSRAALKSDQILLIEQGIDQLCNNITELEYCHIPACLDFCVDYDVTIEMGMTFDTEQRYSSSGGVALSGGATYYQGFKSVGGNDGDVVVGPMISGLALVVSQHNAATAALGGLFLVGSADILVIINRWLYAMTGDIMVSGANLSNNTQSTSYSYTMTGGTQISGTDSSSSSGNAFTCFPSWLTTLQMDDEFGTWTLDRVDDNTFQHCRQMMISSDDGQNTLVSAPVLWTFTCGDDFREPWMIDYYSNPTPGSKIWKMMISFPRAGFTPGAIPGYTCSTLFSAPVVNNDPRVPETNNFPNALPGTGNRNFPIDTYFYAPCYQCWSPATALNGYYHAYQTPPPINATSYPQPNDTVGIHVYQSQSMPLSPGSSFKGGAGVILSFVSTGNGTQGLVFAGVDISGQAVASQSYPEWYFTTDGGITTDGSATLNRLVYMVESGGAVLDGMMLTALGQWSWSHNTYDGIILGGEATTSQDIHMQSIMMQSVMEPEVYLGAYAAITYSQVALNIRDISLVDDSSSPQLEASIETINTACDCNAIGSVVQMRHNFGSVNKLAEFLNRNHLAIPSTLEMSYNSLNKAWQSNLHYRGYAKDGLATETWNIVFDWQCTQVVGGFDLGSPHWKYGACFTVKNSVTNEDYSTRLLLTFSRLGPCQNGLVYFNIQANTSTNIVTTDPRYQVYSSLIQDDIGLFRSVLWRKNPVVSVTISESELSSPVTRITYNPIFPEV